MKKKRCKIVMLPTGFGNSNIQLGLEGGYIYYKTNCIDERTRYQHLYITSDDKIEVGDWYIKDDEIKLWQGAMPEYHKLHSKKIIATTDLLKLYPETGEYGASQNEEYVPQIPQAFIEEYCLKGGIDEVDVEYEVTPSLKIGDNYNIGGEVRKVTDVWLGTNDAWYVSTPNNHAWSCPIELNPKVNSDNTINIHSIKDTYTRDEVINKLKEYWNKTHGEGANNQRLIDWIKENL
jgi:hypothetical protein